MESRFNELKQSLIDKLKQRGANDARRVKRGNVEFMRIASDEETGKALILHADGSWSKKLDMMGFDIGNVDMHRVLEEYAEVTDIGFRLLNNGEFDEWDSFTQAFISPAMIAAAHRNADLFDEEQETDAKITGSRVLLTDEEYEIKESSIEQEFEAKKQQYLADNNDQLLGGILILMEQLVSNA